VKRWHLIGDPRRAATDEADAVANLWLRARAAAAPAIPPPVHREDVVRAWFATVVLSTRDVWVIDHDDRLVAMMVLIDGWIDQLYVEPTSVRRVFGSRLLCVAKDLDPAGLELWTFAANSDGENEERAPAVRYRWPGVGR
jgi:hypothetical protein